MQDKTIYYGDLSCSTSARWRRYGPGMVLLKENQLIQNCSLLDLFKIFFSKPTAGRGPTRGRV
jgi:hypothetical protein